MFRQGTVARFAIYVRVPAVFLLVENVRVAGFASLMAGEVDGTGSDVGQRVPAIVAVLSKALRNHEAADSQKNEHAEQEDSGEPKKMACVFERVHSKNPALG